MIVSGIKILKTNEETMLMVVKEFDKVLLKTGEMAYIVDVIVPAKAYVVDINKPDGVIETDVIEHEDIEGVIVDEMSEQQLA